MRIMFVGDLSLGEHFFSFGHGPRSLIDREENIFESVAPLFAQADYVVGNLEGPISDIGLQEKCPLSRVFRGSPASADQLASAHVNILSVANNHSMQHGTKAFDETVRLLKNANIRVLGLEGAEPLVIRKDGLSIGILAYSGVPDNEYPEQTKYSVLHLETCLEQTKALSQKVDGVVVILHWGIEGKAEPTMEQRYIARELRSAGAHFIIGHHPHVMYEIEPTDRGLVAYSLGNFVFELPWDKRMRTSGILDIEISGLSSKNSGPSYEANFWPVWILKNGKPLLSAKTPRVVAPSETFFCGGFKSQGLHYQGLRKLSYLMLNIIRGKTLLKLRFLTWKLRCKLQNQK